ncbi:hypothetical protein LTR78_005366 [Recurvomyces mirabilis]|uniref:Uncharacterized protein n=1 Tax=Recurvomyces mirabilis TaxID=574656 RepID=A0AAE0WMT9_9PEZI|nr:hypothetical protein LTR78_005366 [Recurvomyces mirabilis]KAK5152727.1 hypothetical protein LTS14_008261 [Recurvomyces mirabilis]
MPSLTELIQVIAPDREEEPEDIFASAPGLIFPDDLLNHHGDAESTIVYKSRRFGDIELTVADPQGEDERQLFSHYLWNAGVKMAELVSGADDAGEAEGEEGGKGRKWSVKGQTVLELGAGVGLGGIVASLAGAKEVVISDYPAPVVLENARKNATKAIPQDLSHVYHIEGHEWGDFSTSFAESNKQHFTTILAADCLWMPHQHVNLIHSMLHFLTLNPTGRIFVLAGFHTGRAKLAAFFETAVEQSLMVEEIYEEDSDGARREWQPERDGGREDPTGRKRWLVIARLKRNEHEDG